MNFTDPTGNVTGEQIGVGILVGGVVILGLGLIGLAGFGGIASLAGLPEGVGVVCLGVAAVGGLAIGVGSLISSILS